MEKIVVDTAELGLAVIGGEEDEETLDCLECDAPDCRGCER